MGGVNPKEAVNPEEAGLQTLDGTDWEGVGDLFKNAQDYVKENRTCVLVTLRKDPLSLVYAGGGLNYDPECLKASGLWDEVEQQYSRSEKAILSVQFTPRAIMFALIFKNDCFLKDFEVCNPSHWCDPDFRFHLQQSKDTLGFMVQLEETQGLSESQENETQMAMEAGLKIFRTSMDHPYDVVRLSKRVRTWYDSECANNDLEEIR
mmetsp:Transcript_51952/g.100374  ORF Transcript_51952/g.100374 Transcript_51952/m.100374 type:complete len:206 (-) Transcript_51952:169-786(-)